MPNFNAFDDFKKALGEVDILIEMAQIH